MSQTISRREFVKRSALAAAGLAVPPFAAAAEQWKPLKRKGAPKKVIVIGAGLAGLAAAYELVQAGHAVTVLEARLRAGGRVYTLREPFSDGLYSEAGGIYLPANHAYTMHYARLFKLPLVPVPPGDGSIFHVRGKRLVPREGAEVAWPLDLTRQEQRLGWDGMYAKYILPVAKQVGDPSTPDWPPARLKKYDQVSFAELLHQQGASRDAVALLRLGYLDTLGDGVDAVSALQVLRDEALFTKAKSYTINGGNDALPKALALKIADKIHYGAPVVALEQDSRGVRVTCRRAGGPQTLAADRLICTLPFSVLRRVAVAPAFTPKKQQAVRDLLYTSVTRVYLQSRKKFWIKEGEALNANTDLPIKWCLDGAFGQPGPRGILESYMAGPEARRAAAMPESSRLAFTLTEMDKVFPGIRDHYEGGTSYCWDQDEWARGAYAWFRPGQMSSLLPHLAGAEGRVHFAGEHTSAWSGWMQGALESGNRAAREVNEAP